jgi:hypothetical protein
MIQILLLAGWSESGKDTAADYLVEKYGYKKFAFADAPKIAVANKYNFPLGWTKSQEGKALQVQTENGLRTVRDLIIEYANSERAKNPYAWAEVTANEIKDAVNSGHTHFVISDWRLIDELIGLKCELSVLKAVILPIRIQRDDQIISPVADKTEYSLLGFPFYIIILNPSDKYFFHNIVRNLYNILPTRIIE